MTRWLITFTLASVLTIAVVLAALWAINGFDGLGIGVSGTMALAGGIVATVALGIGLMALVFASDRGGTDAEVGGTGPGKR